MMWYERPRQPHPFDGIDGLRPVDPKDLQEYERVMREEGIPEIIKAVRRREGLAHESRQRYLG